MCDDIVKEMQKLYDKYYNYRTSARKMKAGMRNEASVFIQYYWFIGHKDNVLMHLQNIFIPMQNSV